MATATDTMIRVLVVDDHAVVREGIRSVLERQPGFEVVGEAADGASAIKLVPANASSRAASATPWAWLPAEAATTPRARS